MAHGLHGFILCFMAHGLHGFILCFMAHGLHGFILCFMAHGLHGFILCFMAHGLHGFILCFMAHGLHGFISSANAGAASKPNTSNRPAAKIVICFIVIVSSFPNRGYEDSSSNLNLFPYSAIAV